MDEQQVGALRCTDQCKGMLTSLTRSCEDTSLKHVALSTQMEGAMDTWQGSAQIQGVLSGQTYVFRVHVGKQCFL